MRYYYTDKEVGFFLECILEARTRREIINNIYRNRTIGPTRDRYKALEKRGHESPNTSAYDHIQHMPNNCAIMAAAHATGEHPVKILHRLMRDHVSHPPTSTSYVRDRPTHPLVIHHILKKLGYKLKRVPREEHGYFIHHHSDLHDLWYEHHHPEDEDHEHEEHHQKELFHNVNDDKKHPSRKPFIGSAAHIVSENLEHGKKYIAVTHHMSEDPSDEYVDSASGKSIHHMDGSGSREPTPHTFNIERNKVRDHSLYSRDHETDEHQVSHLFEVQKDLRHPRWRHEDA